MTKRAIVWSLFSISLGAASCTPAKPPAISEAQLPCATEIPKPYYVLASKQSSADELSSAIKNLNAGDIPASWTSATTALQDMKKNEARLLIVSQRIAATKNQLSHLSVEDDTSNNAKALKNSLNLLTTQQTQIQQALENQFREFSVIVGENLIYRPSNRELKILVIARDAQDKLQVVRAGTDAARAIERILKDELEWIPGSEDSVSYKTGFKVSLVDQVDETHPPVCVRLNAGENRATVKKDEFFKAETIGTRQYRCKVKLGSTEAEFAKYHRNVIALNLSDEEERDWVVDNNFGLVKFNLVHEVCHVLGMVHELQTLEGRPDVAPRPFQEAVNNGLLLLAPEWASRETHYKRNIVDEAAECAGQQSSSTSPLGVCRWSPFDQRSIMCYWLPVSALSKGNCARSRASLHCTLNGNTISSGFLGWHKGDVPTPGNWLTSRDKQSLSN